MLIESLFCSEAIEKEMKLSIAAPLIEIFSQQDALLSLPETSLLVAVATMTCQFVFSQFFLVWMPSGQDGKWSKEDEEASIEGGASKSSPQKIHVSDALLNRGG